eukprot:3095878-Prymnesium_polylepis.1
MRVPRLPWLALCAQPRRASRVMVVEPGPCLMPRGVGGVPRARVRTWTMLCAVASGCGKEGRQADDVQYDWCRDSLYVGGAAVLYVRAAFRGPCYVLAGCLPCSVYVWGGCARRWSVRITTSGPGSVGGAGQGKRAATCLTRARSGRGSARQRVRTNAGASCAKGGAMQGVCSATHVRTRMHGSHGHGEAGAEPSGGHWAHTAVSSRGMCVGLGRRRRESVCRAWRSGECPRTLWTWSSPRWRRLSQFR